jgi:protein-S-isoprenylcysteine O-methyltransferase Ste14
MSTAGIRGWAGLSASARGRILLATNVILSGWLLHRAWALLSSAGWGDLYFALPQGAVEILLACLVLFRAPPRHVRLSVPVMLAAVVSNGHFALFDFETPTNRVTAGAGSVLLVGAVYLAAYAHLVLGRSFSILPAVRELRTRGPYRVVRHPIYLALIVTDVGLVLSRPDLRTVCLALLGITAHVVRVLQEESMWLRFSTYRQYRQRTRYRLVPFVF